MGTQITIEIKDLEEAGWVVDVEWEGCFDYDHEGNEIPNDHFFMVISKGEWRFNSYAPDCFHADCNELGSIVRFKVAGLLDIPHILG